MIGPSARQNRKTLARLIDMGREFFEQSGNGAFTTFDEVIVHRNHYRADERRGQRSAAGCGVG
jgi:hypothetical protein